MPDQNSFIEQAARLLRRMSFSANSGDYLEGEFLSVTVSPQWNEDHQTINVLINCYAFGQRRVAWEGLPVLVRPSAEEKASKKPPLPSAVAFLSLRGQAIIPAIVPGEYQLSSSSCWGGSVSLPDRATWLFQGLAAASDEPPYVSESVDKKVTASIVRAGAQESEIAFETAEPGLADALVRFAFVAPDGEVEREGEVQLGPTGTGVWNGKVRLREPCELVFQVISPNQE